MRRGKGEDAMIKELAPRFVGAGDRINEAVDPVKIIHSWTVAECSCLKTGITNGPLCASVSSQRIRRLTKSTKAS